MVVQQRLGRAADGVEGEHGDIFRWYDRLDLLHGTFRCFRRLARPAACRSNDRCLDCAGSYTPGSMSQVRPLLSPCWSAATTCWRSWTAASSRPRRVAGTPLLSGEAGIGKTRMVRAVLRKAERDGDRVRGPISRPRSAGSARLDPRHRAHHAGASGVRDLGDDVSRSRRRRADALGARRISSAPSPTACRRVDQPTLLVFDDLQWADELSLEVLSELARLAPDRPLFLLGAYRVHELSPGSIGRVAIAAPGPADGRRGTPRASPEGYEDGARRYVPDLDGPATPRRPTSSIAVYVRTLMSILLHVEELLGALDEAERTDSRGNWTSPWTETLEDAILQRIARLSHAGSAGGRPGRLGDRALFRPRGPRRHHGPAG